MVKVYTFLGLVASTFLLVSFSINPPDGKTGAPGDGFCGECHNSSNPPINGTISVEGFPVTITPLDTYHLTVVNRNTVGDAVRGGFQMTILGPFNTKAGKMERPSANSALANALGRQYFEHHPAVEYPDTNVVRWTVDWIAPQMAASSVISCYVAGVVANGDFQNTGDRPVNSISKGSIIVTATDELADQKPTLYPNPGKDFVHVELPNDMAPNGKANFYNMSGSFIGNAELDQGDINCPDIPAGIYLVEIEQTHTSYVAQWIKL